jgi:predicted anti-sigma-YlaC factor YlaD
MDCSRSRTAISARLDGAHIAEEQPDRGLDAHLEHCAACRAFADEATRLHRSVRVLPAPTVPELAPGILAAIDAEHAPPPAQEAPLRALLVAIALVQIAVALPALVLGSDAGLPVHTARHLGSFDVALGVGFMFAAWRPERIPGLLPIVAALAACLVGTSLLDVIGGTTGASAETHHATDVGGLVVVWLLSRATTARRVRLA